MPRNPALTFVIAGLAIGMGVLFPPEPACAATLRIFFASQGLSNSNDTNSAISGAPTLGNPTVVTSTGARRFYVWAGMSGSPTTQTWNGISLNVRVTGSAQITGHSFWNYTNGGYVRWQSTNQGTLNGPGTILTGVSLAKITTGNGVNNTASAMTSDGQYHAATNATLIGYVTIQGDGQAFIGVGSAGIARQGAAGPEPIDFGFGDETDTIDGNDFGVYSSQADAISTVPALRPFFAVEGLSNPDDTNGPIIGSPTLGNPLVSTAGGPRRVYVWAQMNGSLSPQTWNGISLNVRVTGSAQITGHSFWNYTNGGYVRWQSTNQGTLNGPGTILTDVSLAKITTGNGVNNTASAMTSDGQYHAATNATLIGYVTIQGDGQAFIGVGSAGIARQGAAGPEPIDFGFGDETDTIDGNDFGVYSSQADANLSTVSGVPGNPIRNRSLLSIYPNPTPDGHILAVFPVVAEGSPITLTIYDTNGRRIRTLLQGLVSPGTDRALWNGIDDQGQPVSAGVYFLRLEAGPHRATERLVLVR